MPEREANLPADIFQPEPGDEKLETSELALLDLFEGIDQVRTLYKYPGSLILRKCLPGQIMCRQGEVGISAFYILPSQDVLELRRLQLSYIDLLLDPKESSPLIPQRFKRLSPSELRDLRTSLETEIAEYSLRHAAVEEACERITDEKEREKERERLTSVGKVKLLTSLDPKRPRKGLLHRLLNSWRRPRVVTANDAPGISVGTMKDLDPNTLEAQLSEREVFGEMSCLNRAPRSATVIVERPCYMLEFLRNVLDMLYKDDHYKEKTDKVYRKRVLDRQVQKLSIFKHLTEAEYEALKPKLQLVDFTAGEVIFDEHEDSDCLYLIRSGLVKVVKHASSLLSEQETTEIVWKSLGIELTEGASRPGTVAGAIWMVLKTETQEALTVLASGAELTEAQRLRLVHDLNEFIRDGNLQESFGKKRDDVLAVLDQRVFDDLLASFPVEVKKWSDLRVRLFHRTLLETVCIHGLPRCEHRTPRTLNYLSKGEILGEIGMLTGEPRSASCIAFDQRDRGQEQSKEDRKASPSRVELVRLNRADLAAVSQKARKDLEDAKEKRLRNLKENQRVQSAPVRTLQSQTAEFEQLGLVQGQELMLIDLEKCTRCGACVEACVDAHADGRNRLYLDGPRFDKYLVPITCRSCLDPVCMIGCPVGAIYRGDNGEIRIRDHCIGCKLCADQCPYGSIHMSEREYEPDEFMALWQLEKDVVLKEFTRQAVVCDLCQSHYSGKPSCVYACPHDAAMRVDARSFFGVTD